MRREPIEVRKATLASILRKARPGILLNEHLEHPDGLAVFQHACRMGLEGIVSKRLGSRYRWADRQLAEVQEPCGACSQAGSGGGLAMNRETDPTIRQIEFELEKAEHGMAMPYDAEHVAQLRHMLREARKQKLSAGLRARREKGSVKVYWPGKGKQTKSRSAQRSGHTSQFSIRGIPWRRRA